MSNFDGLLSRQPEHRPSTAHDRSAAQDDCESILNFHCSFMPDNMVASQLAMTYPAHYGALTQLWAATMPEVIDHNGEVRPILPTLSLLNNESCVFILLN